MLKIRPLNRDSLSDEDAPMIRKEAQEEIALDLYNSALRFQYDGQLNESEAVLKQLLQENIPQLESRAGLPSTISTLKYSCYTNLGKIAQSKGDTKEALDNYLSASELDKKDVSLWYKIGKLALQLDRFRQAAYAFSQGLECNESHWPCLDQLIIVLYAIRDTIGCLYYITKALILDPHYTRGLVLRKRIYETNPFTEEYYKSYNPDYILEPELCVTIDEAEEKECLETVEKLCNRIDAVERSLATKPLPCITLPSQLTDYTWVNLGCVLTELHKYISDNNMSHFCKINLIKCIEASDVDELMNFSEVACINSTVVEVEVKSETEVEAKIVDDEQNVERRMSTNSENNGDVNDSGVENINSSQAEDNDEMDLDTEDQEESTDQQKVDKKRGTKRRRDLLLDLQVWGWHSKRKSVKKGKSEKDLTVEDALKRIIPPHLMSNGLLIEKSNGSGDDSFNTSDMCRLFVERYRTANCISPINSPTLTDNTEYFGSQFEKDDVIKFWTKQRECCDAVSLIEDYVHALGLLWQHKWPIKLISIYIDAYNMYREHFEHPQLCRSETTFEELRNDASATLLYGELLLYRTNNNDNLKIEEEVHPMSLGHLQLLSARDDIWEDDYASFFIRVHWLRAHIFRKTAKNNLAINFLQLVEEMILLVENRTEHKYRLVFQNSEKYMLVTAEITQKLLRHLEMIDSLSRLEQLYNTQCYVEVAEILETTFVSFGGPPTSGRIDRPTQLVMLMDSLWYTDKSKCFVWTEKCLQEAVEHFVKPQKDKDRWALILDKCFEVMHQLILEETISIVDGLAKEQKVTLVRSLCRTVCHQLNLAGVTSLPLRSVVPWMVLHFILLREEHKEQARNVVSHVRKKRKLSFSESETVENHDDRPVPPSVAILFSAHDFLGRKGWCLTTQGKLLHFMIDTILDRLDTPIFESLREKIDIHLEQAFFCLYQHPSKKNKISRHLADHNVNPLPLTWEHAQQLYEFNCPYVLPEFDSFKSTSISSDLEQLFQRIISLVPRECDPQPFVSKISDFVNGTSVELPASLRFPNKIRSIYYLLGDYYFKQNEIGRSVKYFYMDLCINPLRLDTWADLALGIASQIENKLNHCERFKNESEFLDKAKSARVCFQQALVIMPAHVTLWIEFGAFEYTAHSFCSRVLKYESDTLSMEKFEVLENQKESYLDSAGNSFTKALDLYQPEQTEADERWLHHYMLGKVAEKRRKEPVDYLQHYLTAAALLSENNATYPEKINYHNPQHLSVEALEIHYRIHASILKFLELHEGKNILISTGKMFKKCLDTSKLYETTVKVVEPVAPKPNDFQTIVKCVNDMLDEVENRERAAQKGIVVLSDTDEEKAPKTNVQELMDAMMRQTMEKEQVHDTDSDATNVEQDYRDAQQIKKSENVRKSVDETTTASSSSSESSSSDSESDDSSSSSSTGSSDNDSTYLSDSDVLNVMDRCIVGLEQCMKRFPQNYKALYRLVHLYFNYKMRKDLAKCRQLLLSEYKCKNGVIVSGLFSEHKANNFFNGVWRIPSSEIDRPGSLAAHMARCVTILLQVLRQNNDHKMLLDVCLQLKRTPDADKVYMRHSEREQLSEQSLSLCIQTLRTQIKTVATASGIQKLLLEIFRSYQRIQKHIPQKEGVFAGMLGDIYKKSLQDKPPENVNILDMAIKHCQQYKTAEKLKQQQQKQNVTAALVPPPVVLPTPSTATPSNVNQPLKRPTLGRPRGRPPGPKQPGLNRSPRGRGASSSSGAYSWQNMMYDQKAMNYMLKYQEELLRQYNTLSEMTFQNQFTQFTLPSLKTPLLSPSQLVQVFGQMSNTNVNPMMANQLSQSLSNLSPNMLKKLIDQYASTSKPKVSTSNWLTTGYTSKATTKPTYTTAGFNKNLQTSTYKYPFTELPKAKGQETVTINLPITEEKKMSLPSAMPSISQTDYLSAASMLKDRSNLTITPVTQTNAIAPPQIKLPSAVTGKTLQEKLADKQKQHNLSVEGKVNEKGKSQLTSTFSTPPSSNPHVNLPSFPLDSGISISQVSVPKTSKSSEKPAWDFGSKKSKKTTLPPPSKTAAQYHLPPPSKTAAQYHLPPNIPLSVSVVKVPKAAKPQSSPSDDDVIIIE